MWTTKERIHAELARYGLTDNPMSGVVQGVYCRIGTVGETVYIATVSGIWVHNRNKWRCHVRALDRAGDREVGAGNHPDYLRAIRAAMALAGLEVKP